MFIQNGHSSYNKLEKDKPYGNDKNGYTDFHPMGKITIARRKVPVESDQTNIEPVEYNPQNGQHGCPLDQSKAL